MDKLAALKSKLDNREKIFGFLTALRDESVLPAFQRDGVDFILYDLEHGSSSGEQISDLLHACRVLDIPTIIRVQDAIYHLIAKQIDMGADGIMLPRTETLAQVETAISAIRFAPIGRKGCGGRDQFRKNETFAEFQTSRLLILQIESPLGVTNLPDMLNRYGDQVAGIVIGPNDLSIQVGTPLDLESEPVLEQIKKTMAICDRFGKSCGIFCGSLDIARRWYGEGMNILWTGSDTGLLQLGISAAIGQVRDFPNNA
ncbi:MAG: hypothetical protein GX173_09295 [Ruminococcaceae bacterium]|nr:hypothetical protein [Oscillospiraceae bacterium]